MISKRSIFLTLLLILALFIAVSFIGCGVVDDDYDDAVWADDDDDDDDDDDEDDDDDDDSGPTWTGTEMVFVDTYEGLVNITLNGLPSFMWEDPEDGVTKQAMYIQTVVDAAIDKITSVDIETDGYRFNFVAADQYNIFDQKLYGDFTQLPDYATLSDGWFIEYIETIGGGDYTDIQVIWDETLEYPTFMSARMMNGGTIGMIEELYFDGDFDITVEYSAKGLKGAVSLLNAPAFYDGADLAVYLSYIVNTAALNEFDPKTYDYGFNLISNDASGNYDLLADHLGDDTSLLPAWKESAFGKDIMHGWVKTNGTDGFTAFFDTDSGFDIEYNVDYMDGGAIVVYDLTD